MLVVSSDGVIAMSIVKPKKLLIMNILDILRRYTDGEHRLSQKDIVDILREEYHMEADRKTVKRNITNLLELGYDIRFSEVRRMMPGRDGQPEENCIQSDFYLERDISDDELRLLIDALLSSTHIPSDQCEALVGKLVGLSNRYFDPGVEHISTMPALPPQCDRIHENTELLHRAIAAGQQVAFAYHRYGTDQKLHPVLRGDGTVKDYVVSPYGIAVANGRYYLICNHEDFSNAEHYRIDHMTDIRLLDTPVKPMEQVQELKKGISLPRHMAEQLYFYPGESVPVTFRVKKFVLDDVMDWFGSDVSFSEESGDEVTAHVTVNYYAMRSWALQYARHIRILTPTALAYQIKEDLRAALEKY